MSIADILSGNSVATLRRRIAGHLVQIEGFFKPGVVLTFIARNPAYPDSDVIVTDDDLDAVIASIRKLQQDENSLDRGIKS